MLKDNTMRFKLIIIFFCFWTFDSWAQCCCGKFYFRIYDPLENKIYPALSDTFKMNIDPNAKDLGYWKQIDGRKLPVTKLSIKTMQTKGNAGISEINLSKFSFTNLLFEFRTGCFMDLKKISFTKGDKKMILNLVDIPTETTILMDSIPFVEGEVTYNIEKIVRDHKDCEFENLPGNKFYLHYYIPYNLIKMDLPLPSTDIKEIKGDTLYYYTDSLKTKILAKGKIKVYKKSFRYYSSFEKEMTKEKIIYNLKRGTWVYFYENAELRKTEIEEKPHIERHYPKHGLNHAR